MTALTTRTARMFRTVLVAAAIAITVAVGSQSFATAEGTGTFITVTAGDTLWSLAEQYAPQGSDPRDWIYDIAVLNNLQDSLVHPGQQLELPN